MDTNRLNTPESFYLVWKQTVRARPKMEHALNNCFLLARGWSTVINECLSNSLPVLCPYLEIALCVVAYGAYLGSSLANNDVSTIAALPDGVAVA